MNRGDWLVRPLISSSRLPRRFKIGRVLADRREDARVDMQMFNYAGRENDVPQYFEEAVDVHFRAVDEWMNCGASFVKAEQELTRIYGRSVNDIGVWESLWT